MFRIISELKPPWVLGENVPGIIGIFVDQAISDLENEGYSCETFVLPACAFDAPHRRDRLFIIANNASGRCNDGGHNRQVRHIQDNIIGNLAESEQKREGREHESGATGGSELASTPDIQRLQTWNERKKSGEPAQKFAGGEFAGTHTKRNWRETPPQPTICGMDDGIPHRVDRLKSLGNAVVPQVAEHIGRIIMEANSFCL